MKTTTIITERKDGTIKCEFRFVCDRASRRMDYDDRDDMDAWQAAEAVREMDVPKIGKIYMVASNDYAGPNGRKNTSLYWGEDNGEGWGGNSDQNIKRYHGWRGTTCDWCLTGLGVRRCLDVYQSGTRSKRVVVIFGRDIKKDEP